MRTRTLLLSLLLALPLAGCRDKNVAEVDRAAEAVVDLRESADGEAIAELGAAEAEFEARRTGIVEQYRTQHRVFAMQTEIATSLLGDPLLTDDARQKANDQILNLERELEEAEQAIDTLGLASAEQWDASYTTAQTAMMQLEGAHQDAWDMLSVERALVRPS